MINPRSLIKRLADALEGWKPSGDADLLLLAEARAYLSSPDEPAVPDGREPASVAYEPSDEELLELMPETMRDEFAACANTYSQATGGAVKPGIFRTVLNTVALEYARAVLARWGGQCDKTSTPVNR